MVKLPEATWWQRLGRRLPWRRSPEDRAAAAWRRLQRQCPPAALAAQQIPPAARNAWQALAADELPGVRLDETTWVESSVALAQFFEASRLQHDAGPCALPSRAADSIWHAWLKADPASLADWQQRFFGRVVQHREAGELGAPLDQCLARTWVGACRSEGRSALAPRLPLVFGVDGQLRLPTGWAYGFERGRLVHRQIDGFGRPGGMAHEHAALAGAGLAALGLLSAAEIERMQRRAKDGGSAGGDSSFSWSWSSDGGSDGCSSSDGTSSDCGSSCGSSCGGGGD